MPQSNVLPVIIKANYGGGDAFGQLVQDARRSGDQAKQAFEKDFAEIGKLAKGSLSGGLSTGGKVDVGLDQFRQAAAEATAYRGTLEQVGLTAKRLALSTSDASTATQAYLKAMTAQIIEARQSERAALDQVTAHGRLQAALNDNAGAVDHLSASYRALEQARNADNIAAAAAEVRNRRFTEFDQSRGIGGDPGSSARASAAVFEEQARTATMAAQAQRDLASAASQFKAQIDPAVASQQRFTGIMREADRLYKAGAIDLKEFAAAHRFAQAAMNQSAGAALGGVGANRQLAGSHGALRTATVQSGQQLQDIAISLYSGQRASVVFAQQIPQLAFALSALDGSTNATHARIGRFATFLSGPWGLAVGLGVGALGTLATQFFSTGDAAKDAEKKSYDFSDGLSVLELSAKQTADAMRQLADEMRNAIVVQGNFLRQKADAARGSVSEIEGRIASDTAELRGLNEEVGGFNLNPTALVRRLRRRAELTARLEEDRKALPQARAGALSAGIAVAQSNVVERLDAATAATGRYSRAVGELERRFELSKKDPISAGSNFIDEAGYEAEFERLTKLKDTEVEAAREADRKKRPGRKGADPAKVAERERRADFRLTEFANDAEDRIGRIRQSFSDIPPAVARINDGMATLGDLSRNVDEQMARGLDPARAAELKQQIADLAPVIKDSINQPFRDMLDSAEKNAAIQDLLIAGKEDEAEVLARVLDLQSQSSAVTDDQIAAVYGIVLQERQRTRELEKQNELRQRDVALVEATRDNVRSAMQDLARGGGAGAIGQTFKRQFDAILTRQVDNLFEGLFADFFRDERDKALGFDQVREASEKQVVAIRGTVTALDDFKAALRGTASAVSGSGASDGFEATFDAAFAKQIEAANDNAYLAVKEIVAEGGKDKGQNAEDEPSRRSFLATVSETLAGAVGGKTFGKAVGDAISDAESSNGAAYGALAGGMAFGSSGSPLLSAIGGGVGEKVLGPALGKGFASIAKGLGDLGGPLGGIIGGLAGGLIGSLMTSTPRASSTIGVGANGQLQVVGTRGNSGALRKASEGSAGEALSTLDRIAEALGASIDAANGSVSIGVRKGKYRVDTSGSGITKTSRGAIDFGEDSAAAIRAATLDLIQDGVLQGLRDSTQRLLQQAKDLDTGIQKALDFENVFVRLKQFKDPVGAAVDAVDKEFTRLIKLFEDAGASASEWADLEELYGKERADAIREAQESALGGLRDFISGLQTGDNGFSLRTRLANAKDIYDPLAAAVRAGETVDYNDFTDAADTMLRISRELFGSQAEYFDTLNSIMDLSKQALAGQENVVAITEGRDTPFSNRTSVDTVPIVSAIDTGNAAMFGQVAQTNQQITQTNRLLSQMLDEMRRSPGTAQFAATGTYF